MVKAAREAGENTSWVEPREEYEAALNRFVDAVLDPSASNGFMPAFVPFCKKIIFFGLFNSLSQCVLKIALPGVPDFYQGTELPHLALVDPDNRREVDYGNRMRLLAAMRQERSDPLAQVEDLLDSRDDGRIKLFVMARGLAARREHSDLFQNGGYLPLETVGPFDRNIVAFARIFDARWCVVAVPRFVTALVPENQDPLGRRVWRDTAIVLPPEAPRSWYDIFARRRLKGAAEILVGEALQHFPVSLLLGEKTP
jgi:(1->4)-alpha-D-glucan 1-alpha-D-glucosylmutase